MLPELQGILASKQRSNVLDLHAQTWTDHLVALSDEDLHRLVAQLISGHHVPEQEAFSPREL